MEVVYKKSITEKIIEENYKAKQEGKEIEKIILTEDEWKQFGKETKHLNHFACLEYSYPLWSVDNECKKTIKAFYNGVLIEREEKK